MCVCVSERDLTKADMEAKLPVQHAVYLQVQEVPQFVRAHSLPYGGRR